MTTAPVALVTGASRGIGAHLVRALVGAGWQVGALARDVARLVALTTELHDTGSDTDAETGHGGAVVLPIGCDVTDADQVATAVERVRTELGKVDLLVNNAGSNDAESPLWETDPQRWWQVLETNVKGPYLLTRAVVPQMIAAGGGRVVNINSGAGVRDYPDMSAYNASKTALCRITSATAGAGAAHQVFAFDLAPGVVRTDMTRVMASHADRTEWTDPAQVAELLLALAAGDLDDYSGRMVRVGVDTVPDLQARAASGLPEDARRLRLKPWGDDDPLG